MTLLPRILQVQDDMPLRLVLAPLVGTPRPAEAGPANDWNNATPADKPPKRTRLRLTEAADQDAAAFSRLYGDGNCACHICPPCGSCTHPGNPLCLDSDDDAWVWGFEEGGAE